MDIYKILQIASVIVALGSFAGLAVQQGFFSGLRKQVNDQKIRIEFLEAKGVRDDTTIARQEATIATQAAEIASLKQLVTGEVHWTAISDVLDHHHKAALEHWAEARNLLIEIRDKP